MRVSLPATQQNLLPCVYDRYGSHVILHAAGKEAWLRSRNIGSLPLWY